MDSKLPDTKRFLGLLVVVLAVLLALACNASAGLSSQTSGAQSTPPAIEASPVVVVATPTPLTDSDLALINVEEQLITNLYDRVGPSVVHITARVVQMTFFFGALPSEGTGSGFVIDKEGHILTDYHVVEGAESIE